MQCTDYYCGISNAGLAGGCIAQALFLGLAMQVWREFAVQILDLWDEQCQFEEDMQCKSKKAGTGNAIRGQDCSAEARKPAPAMQTGAGTAVQKQESRHRQCKPGPGLQCRSKKAGTGNASRHRDCSAKAQKKTKAMQSDALHKERLNPHKKRPSQP